MLEVNQLPKKESIANLLRKWFDDPLAHENLKYREWEVQWKFLEQPDLYPLLNRGHVVKNYHTLDISDLPNHKLETMLDKSFKWACLIAVDAAR